MVNVYLTCTGTFKKEVTSCLNEVTGSHADQPHRDQVTIISYYCTEFLKGSSYQLQLQKQKQVLAESRDSRKKGQKFNSQPTYVFHLFRSFINILHVTETTLNIIFKSWDLIW